MKEGRMADSGATIFSAPFDYTFPVRSMEDVARLESIPLEQALTVRSTYAIIRNTAHAFADKKALTFLRTGNPDDTPIRWSYSQLLAGIHQTANMLHRLGIGATDVVAILLPACLEYHLALWGGEAAGIVQPLNPLLSDEKLVSLLNTAGAKVLVAYGSDDESEIWSKAMRIREQVPTLTQVLRVAPHDQDRAVAALLKGVADFSALRSAEPSDRLVSGRDIQPGDIAAYFHTGGTTGSPKLARHSHGAQVFTAWACVKMHGASCNDVAINGFPLFHVAGVLPTSLAAFAVGSETVMPTPSLLRNRDVILNYWRLVEKYRATSVSAVPTVLAALTNVPLDGADISTLRYCRTGAAPLSPELAARFKRMFGLHVHESLGMTEMAGISSITPQGVEGPAGCVGFRLPYAQVRVVALDATGEATNRDLRVGEQGMVLFKSPNVFSGFLNPADTAKAFTADGWLITGDLGFLDSEQRLHLTGRAKDLIIRGGHNIDPKMIEDALSAHPAVQLCAAVGAPDAYAGELPVMFATLVPGASATAEELLAYAAGRVDEGPAKPKSLTILDAMPMTNVGKLYKPALRLLAAQAVVAAAIEEVYRDLDRSIGVMPPKIEASEQSGIVVVFSPNNGDARSEAPEARLQTALKELPIKLTIQRGL
jgi:fatty-acyl-CoA synthase